LREFDWVIKKMKNNKSTGRTHQSQRREISQAVPSTVCMNLERGDNSIGVDDVTPNSDLTFPQLSG